MINEMMIGLSLRAMTSCDPMLPVIDMSFCISEIRYQLNMVAFVVVTIIVYFRHLKIVFDLRF